MPRNWYPAISLYALYEGNVRTTGRAGLIPVPGQGLDTNGVYDYRNGYRINFTCTQLRPATTYTMQLVFAAAEDGDALLKVFFAGTGPTQGPRPVAADIAAPNCIGPVGTRTVTDRFSCNSFIGQQGCTGSAMPAGGVIYRGGTWKLNTWATFTLTGAATAVQADIDLSSNATLLLLYKTTLGGVCDLDTSAIVAQVAFDRRIPFSRLSAFCLPLGEYALQVCGAYSTELYGRRTSFCGDSAVLGIPFDIMLRAMAQPGANNYGLQSTAGTSVYKYNGGAPLVRDRVYTSPSDILGCENTVLPVGLPPTVRGRFGRAYKAAYHEFTLGDSGVAFVDQTSGADPTYQYVAGLQLYGGSAAALSLAQNKHAWPELISGLGWRAGPAALEYRGPI